MTLNKGMGNGESGEVMDRVNEWAAEASGGNDASALNFLWLPFAYGRMGAFRYGVCNIFGFLTPSPLSEFGSD